MRIAMIGCARTWADAPYDDPAWTIWAHCSAQPYLRGRRVDRWFDLHKVEVWRQGKVWYQSRGTDPATYVDWLITRPQPIVMQARYPLIPLSEAYPLAAIVETFGIVPAHLNLTPTDSRWWDWVRDRGEFSSTFAYMLALALYEGDVEEIALYGIDFAQVQTGEGTEEYRQQRPGAKYWVGVARGLGIPVTVARGSQFERQDWIYGYEVKPEPVGV
jgi:hypothetical protein